MHKDKDEKDLAIVNGAVKRFSESRLKNRAQDTTVNNVYSGKDFLNPNDPIDERNTGYSSGHVRSIMEQDTFGPNHSMRVELKRLEGLIPPSRNSDRSRLLVTQDERKAFEKSNGYFGKVLTPEASSPELTRDKSEKKNGGNFVRTEPSYISKDTRTRRNHWFDTYQSRLKVLYVLNIFS